MARATACAPRIDTENPHVYNGIIIAEGAIPVPHSVTIDDPTAAKKVLDTILNTPVSRQGLHVDTAQMQYADYCFAFGEERFTFAFLPYSYFCYGGKEYELGQNRERPGQEHEHENITTGGLKDGSISGRLGDGARQ